MINPSYRERIVRDPKCCGGQPVIRGTRVTLRVILASLAGGDRPEEIVQAFPSICIEDIHAAVAASQALVISSAGNYLETEVSRAATVEFPRHPPWDRRRPELNKLECRSYSWRRYPFMAESLSKSQVDQLGERIRGAAISEADLQLLDSYRRSFAQAYEYVVSSIAHELSLEPTGRPTKSTTSISDKLARESIRLSQMQDVAGCRIVVPDILAQDAIVARLAEIFEMRSVFDRRESPSYGYRAVHVIVLHMGRPVEIQIRTALQHIWAELSEKLSDVISPSIKYGGGPDGLVRFLRTTSQTGAMVENTERRLEDLKRRGDRQDEIAELARSVMETKNGLARMLRDMIGDAHIWMEPT